MLNAEVGPDAPQTCTFVDLKGGGRGEAGRVPLRPRLVQVRVDRQHGAHCDLASACQDTRLTEGVSAGDGRSEDVFVCLFVSRRGAEGRAGGHSEDLVVLHDLVYLRKLWKCVRKGKNGPFLVKV